METQLQYSLGIEKQNQNLGVLAGIWGSILSHLSKVNKSSLLNLYLLTCVVV